MAKKDAIQNEDVSTAGAEEEQPKPTPHLNPRNAHLEAITSQTREQRSEDMKAAGFEVPDEEEEEEPEPAPKPEEEPEPAHSPKDEESDEEEDEEPEPSPDEDEEETLVIEGKETKVPKSKIYDTGKRALQKELAADQNLSEAKRIRAEAEELLSNAQQGKKQHEDADRAVQLSNIAERLQFGEKEDAAEALQEFAELLNIRTENVDMGKLEEQVTQRVEERNEYMQAATYVEENYSDVMGDPILKREFGHRENELRDAGDTRSYKDLYVAIAEELREYKNGNGPTSVADSLEARKNRKKEASKHPGGHSAPAAEEQPVVKKTQKDKIAEVASSRGQRF